MNWVSVKEKLPEYNELVLLIDKAGYYEVGALSENYGDPKFYLGEYFVYLRENDITHWMPLPEPPNGE